jgi:hypothetical protein
MTLYPEAAKAILKHHISDHGAELMRRLRAIATPITLA